jgi:1-acyl-sn-glycerol-3-phosphate acyltransferase
MLHHHYYHPLFHWLFSRLPCIPVKRSRFTGGTAIRYCFQVLRHGQVLCIFPEGGISREHKERGVGHGAALLALRMQAPIVPVGISGASKALGLHQHFPRPKPIKINIGEPLYVAPTETYERALLQEIMENAMTRVQSLLTRIQ